MKKIVISCLGGIAGMVLLSLLAAPAANANNSGCYAHRNQVKPATSVRNCTRQESPQTTFTVPVWEYALLEHPDDRHPQGALCQFTILTVEVSICAKAIRI